MTFWQIALALVPYTIAVVLISKPRRRQDKDRRLVYINPHLQDLMEARCVQIAIIRTQIREHVSVLYLKGLQMGEASSHRYIGG
jgi:hypothetical protein